MNWPQGPVTVRVPATSANLGPGFDALGLALTLHDQVQAQITGSALTIEVSGAGQDAATAGEDHLVVRAMRAGFAVLGCQPPGIALRCVNAIPQGFGLGSSAGAIVAGLTAARALWPDARPAGGALDDQALLQAASGLEGHPDNVAACLAGGLTIAWAGDAGVRLARLEPVTALEPVLCIPAVPVLTAHARAALPQAVPHADAAANSARAALLITALTTRPDLLFDATADFLHQRYRAAAMPATADLITRLRAAGVPAVVSGAGPAVLALTAAGCTPGRAAVASAAAQGEQAWTVLPLNVDRDGAAVL